MVFRPTLILGSLHAAAALDKTVKDEVSGCVANPDHTDHPLDKCYSSNDPSGCTGGHDAANYYCKQTWKGSKASNWKVSGGKDHTWSLGKKDENFCMGGCDCLSEVTCSLPDPKEVRFCALHVQGCEDPAPGTVLHYHVAHGYKDTEVRSETERTRIANEVSLGVSAKIPLEAEAELGVEGKDALSMSNEFETTNTHTHEEWFEEKQEADLPCNGEVHLYSGQTTITMDDGSVLTLQSSNLFVTNHYLKGCRAETPCVEFKKEGDDWVPSPGSTSSPCTDPSPSPAPRPPKPTPSQCSEVASNKKVDCGFPGVDQNSCEATMGCCWKPVEPNPNNEPWCYVAAPSPSPIPTDDDEPEEGESTSTTEEQPTTTIETTLAPVTSTTEEQPTTTFETTLAPVTSTIETTRAPVTPSPQRCQTCLATCAPCKECIEGPAGSFAFGSCQKCWSCWDWDDDELEDDDDDMDEECNAMDKDHDWNDEEVRCLNNDVSADCRACWVSDDEHFLV